MTTTLCFGDLSLRRCARERFDVKAEKHHVIQGPVDIIPLNWRFYDQDFSLKIQMGHTS